MSDASNENEKVPGHSPAAKVGGMRVAGNAHSTADEGTKATSGPLNSATSTAGDAALALANQKTGAQQTIARERHEESVRHAQTKPLPSKEVSHKPQTNRIQQPSKQ